MKTCKICELKHFAGGYCRKHYTNFKRHGFPESKYDRSGYADLGGIRDTGPGRRGSLAVNVINDIKYKAKKRCKEWQLTHQQAFDLIRATCIYCDFKPEWPNQRVGIDRVDNFIGYVPSNCVSCCATCNSAKGQLSVDEFKQWILRVYNKLK